MEREILITDLTAMGGDRVCIAGIDIEWNTIRPVFAWSIPVRNHLYLGEKALIRPRAVVALQLEPLANPEIPHIEDYLWTQPDGARYVKSLDEEHWQRTLHGLVERCPRPLFGTKLREYSGAQRRYVRPEEATHSLGTIQVNPRSCKFAFERSIYEQRKARYRLWFRDVAGRQYEGAAVTDLAVQTWAQRQTRIGESLPDISEFLTNRLNQAQQVFLRLGLPRPSSSHMGRCWLQVNGIYSFPDWLEGRCFADFDAAPG